ncbi:hypothetical protein [Sphingomonas sp. OK281]|uniref:hypothetical protein n=1 Tax=Sphingomonas sp. OK281 TaxID=1881067 RepID=UPI000B84FB8C|nr:hypothetical protein [Sphingomonas sp. OK281]
MSDKILIFLGPNEAFDPVAVERAITSLADWTVTQTGPGIGAVSQYLCARDDSELIVRLSADVETVTVDGYLERPAALFVLAFQSGISNPLRITDMGYNFDLSLRDFTDAEGLQAAASH